MEYSEFVKKVRKQLNYTQKELAEALNVSYATVNRWENKQGHDKQAQFWLETCDSSSK
jgi:transcriptional regulator with XRE-family HTH domain